MKKTLLVLALTVAASGLFAQKKTTTSATVNFDATTSLDGMPKATNQSVIAAFNTTTGAVNFEAAVKSFTFANPTIQGHFNGSTWFDSDKYPNFTFKGQIADVSKVNFTTDGSYTVSVKGDLTIKDVTQSITAPATIVVKDGAISASSSFSITLADYGISNPAIDGGKVSKQPKISVQADLK